MPSVKKAASAPSPPPELYLEHAENALRKAGAAAAVQVIQRARLPLQLLQKAVLEEQRPRRFKVRGRLRLAQLLQRLAQSGVQILLRHRLEDVLHHAVFQRGIGVLKFPISADQHEFGAQLPLVGAANDLQPVGSGHGDVRDHDVGLFPLHHAPQALSVVGRPDQLQTELVVTDHFGQHPADQVFIVRHDQP